MKIHRVLIQGVLQALDAIFGANRVASRELERLFAANPKWGKRDRAFVAATTWEVVRWRRLLETAAQNSESRFLVAAQLLRGGEELPELAEFADVDAPQIRLRLESDELPRAIRESIPDWFDELGAAELGQNWDAEIAALNREAPVNLRANTLKITRDNLRNRLESEGIETETLKIETLETEILETLPDALQLQTRRSIAHLSLYKEGFFEVQDAASQLIAPFLQAEGGMRILDACAGAGGKSLHLAALLGNRGHIVACDAQAEKLIELRRRAARNGVSILETRPPDKVRGQFERVLIDAPCSGSGTLRRQPDLKWRLSPEFLAQIQTKQREILDFYAPLTASGGQLVYATCSILPSENERQIEWFLGRHSGWQWEAQRKISVAESGFDGFFMARLQKA